MIRASLPDRLSSTGRVPRRAEGSHARRRRGDDRRALGRTTFRAPWTASPTADDLTAVRAAVNNGDGEEVDVLEVENVPPMQFLASSCAPLRSWSSVRRWRRRTSASTRTSSTPCATSTSIRARAVVPPTARVPRVRHHPGGPFRVPGRGSGHLPLVFKPRHSATLMALPWAPVSGPATSGGSECHSRTGGSHRSGFRSSSRPSAARRGVGLRSAARHHAVSLGHRERASSSGWEYLNEGLGTAAFTHTMYDFLAFGFILIAWPIEGMTKELPSPPMELIFFIAARYPAARSTSSVGSSARVGRGA